MKLRNFRQVQCPHNCASDLFRSYSCLRVIDWFDVELTQELNGTPLDVLHTALQFASQDFFN
jgi:hypothetical protein